METKYPIHWQFAYGAALSCLKMLVWTFDADIEARGRAYADVPEPEELIRVIDGFLANEAEYILQGDIRNLKEMRDRLQHRIAPIYQAGQESARSRWDSASPVELAQLDSFEQEDFRNEAKAKAPQDASDPEKSWFVEGFCKKWQDKWVEYQLRTAKSEKGQKD